MLKKHTYVYDGVVKEFDMIIARDWHGETVAPSKSKALCNLAYQFKKSTKRTPDAKISLPGELREIG